MKITVSKQEVLSAIQERLHRPIGDWELVSIYNNLAECSVLELNEQTGVIQCDEDTELSLE